MAYKAYGLTSLHEFLGENVIYRRLVPLDCRLPALADLRAPLGLENGVVPRKAQADYGRVVVEMLRQARTVDLPGAAIERVLYIGDTALNDGTAFRNICAAGGWPGWCFIGRDTLDQPSRVDVDGSLYVANRWSALSDFLRFVEGQGFVLDREVAVVIDLDKTAIGARGRNDQVINAARIEGVQRTVSDLLGTAFDEGAFQPAYDELNQSAYYGLTADNQDYVAYICLMLGAGVFELHTVVDEVRSGAMARFTDFIGEVQCRRPELEPGRMDVCASRRPHAIQGLSLQRIPHYCGPLWRHVAVVNNASAGAADRGYARSARGCPCPARPGRTDLWSLGQTRRGVGAKRGTGASRDEATASPRDALDRRGLAAGAFASVWRGSVAWGLIIDPVLFHQFDSKGIVLERNRVGHGVVRVKDIPPGLFDRG